MNCRNKKIFSLLLTLLLILSMPPFTAPAAEGLTCSVSKEGSYVTVSGSAFPDSLVSLVVTRPIDGSRSHLDQTASGGDGSYSFSFALDGGDYRATVSCNGLHRQSDIQIKTSDTKTVTVRVEGKTATRLPQTEVAILAGETTLFDAITSALGSANVEYEVANGLIHAIGGEEGWQWLIDNRGGMHLPSTTLAGGEAIVLVDDQVWNPTITRLTVSPAGVRAGEAFTATLEMLDGASAAPVPGQPVIFGGEAKSTDNAGQVTFTPRNQGIFAVTCEPADPSLIRPVPALVTVGGGNGGGTGTGSITVKMRIEGYRSTVLDGAVTFNPDDYKGSDGKYRFSGPEGVEYTNDRATVLLATVVAWNQNGIRDNSVGHNDNYVARMAGEEEFDFLGKHSTSGWLVRVNNVLINQGVGAWPIRDGDKVEWYYGDVNSYFGSLEAAPASLKTGEKIKVKAFGQSNGGMSMSNTSRKEPMEGATVYVGTTEYTTGSSGEVEIAMNNPGSFEVYAIKLDKDAENEGGGYYFPLMSRTEKARVNVSGSAVAVTVPENPADAAGVIEAVLESESATETQVAEAVQAAAASLANGLQAVKTAEEAGKLLADTAAVTGLLGQAAGYISGSQSAATFADACLEIAGVLAGLAPQLSGEDSRQTLAQAAVQAVNAVARVIGGITDKDKLAQIANTLLDSAAAILGSLEAQQAQAVQQSLAAMVRQALPGLVRETLPPDSLTQGGEVLHAVIDASQAASLAGQTARTVAGLEEKLRQLGLEENRQLPRDIIFHIPSQGEKTVAVSLPPGALEGIAASGAGRMGVITSAASFSFAPDSFGEAARGQEVTLSAARLEADQIPAGAAVPPGSIVIDLQAQAGGQDIGAFNSPVEVSIPYAGTPQNAGAVTVFLLKEDGGVEPVGGLYDPASGTVKFLAAHFSRYFAKESVKQFSDLAEYAWAKEDIETLAGKGVISGKAENLFDPGAAVTRAEFAALVTRMLKYEAPSSTDLPFADVAPDSWYRDAVAAAYGSGLISGRSPGEFDPAGRITRQEMAAIMARVLEQQGYLSAQTGQLDTFSDRAEIAGWAQAAAAMTIREGIIAGMEDGRFAPAENATRAQAAVMLARLYGLVMR